MKKIKLALPWQILIAMALGIIFGIFCSSWVKYISWAGDIFLRLLKMVVIPIIITSMVVGVASVGKSADLGRIAFKTLAFFIGTTLIATFIGLGLVNLIAPGEGANIVDAAKGAEELMHAERVSLGDQLIAIVPQNIFDDMCKGNMLSIIFFSLMFGFFVTQAEEKSRTTVLTFFQSLFEVIMKIIMSVIKLAPIGVFAIVSKMVAQQAGDMAKLAGMAESLGLFLVVVWSGCLIHFFIVMPCIVYFLGHENPYKHMRKMSTAILTAFSTCSSGAALPISLRDSQEKCGISNKIASFVLPLGATIDMNGTALYECAAVIFIAQAYGIEMSFVQQLIVVVTVLFSAIGAASIPMAGLVMLTIALNVAGLPLEGIGIVLAVEQLCDMPRTATNTYGEQSAALVIAKSEGEKLTIDD